MITREQIRDIAGPLPDEVVAEIEKLGATEADLVEAVGWLERGPSMGRDGRHTLTGTVGDLYDILSADLDEDPDRRD
jgi:hypothetical protein